MIRPSRAFVLPIRIEVVALLLLMTGTTSAFSQGGWNIKYVSTDSLRAFIGKEVRLDFKASDSDTLQGEVGTLWIRSLLFREDTITLVLGGESVKFKESWKIYPDHGVVQEQTLERSDHTSDERVYKGNECYLSSTMTDETEHCIV